MSAKPAATGTEQPGPFELAELLKSLDPAVLLNCLVQMSGDPSFLDRYAPHLIPLPTRNALTSHDVAAPVVAEMVAEVAVRLGGGDHDPRAPIEPSLFGRMASLAVGETVSDEFHGILEEQAGFVLSRRVLPTTRRPPADFAVVVIGAGMMGINAGVKLAEAGFPYRIFESRSELGGTWSINRYPGAAVDTPSHYYSYSFEPNPDWSHFYPVGDEYFDYLSRVAEKYRVMEHITFGTVVESCEWDESRQRWMVQTRTGDSVTIHEAVAVVTALGFLNRPAAPDIPGRDTFAGTVVHSGAWDPDIELAGKDVVLLGAGCTAVQIATSIACEVASLTVVQRQPHWIAPAKNDLGEVPDDLRWALRNVPYYHQWFRLKTYWFGSDNNFLTPRIDPEWPKDAVSVSAPNDTLMRACLAHIEAYFADQPDLKAQLTPDYPPYAKRIVRDPGYYDTLSQENVRLLTGGIQLFEPGGVVLSSGERIACDVVVLATGFHIDMLSTIEIRGREGKSLAETWADDPRAYLGILVPGFPNLFTTAGPNSAPNHGGGHNLTVEEQVHYVIECLQLLLETDSSSLEVYQSATDDYNRLVDEQLDQTVWQHGGTASGYYRNGRGRAWLACPWRMVDYWTMLRSPDQSHLTLRSASDLEKWPSSAHGWPRTTTRSLAGPTSFSTAAPRPT